MAEHALDLPGPELRKIIAADCPRMIEAKVHDVENHGIEKVLTLRVAGQFVRAGVPAKVNVAVEDSVRFGWNPGKVMLFDQQTGLNLGHKAA